MTDSELVGAETLREAERAVGHRFARRDYLSEALTHSSAVAAGAEGLDNERLEFLGDRVLGLLIAEWLSEVFPASQEGELALRLNALVRKEACAEVAIGLDLGAFLALGPSEARGGGRSHPAILADACEAVIGALYLDGGLEVARTFVRLHWAARIDQAAPPAQDAKTRLQEWAQACHGVLPAYRTVGRAGPDHAPTFKVEVNVGELAPGEGEGLSKRAAEQAAAAALLAREAGET